MAPPRKKERTPEASRLELALDVLGPQTKAASVAGVSPRQLRKYLSGESAPPVEVLMKIANAAGYNLNWLVAGSGPPRTLNESANPLPGNVSAVLDVRRKLYEGLSALYEGTPWPMSPASDADEFLLIDATEDVCGLPGEAWDEGIALVVAAHKAALGRTRKKAL